MSPPTTMTQQIDLSAGTIEEQDTGGEGPTIVLLHGLLMDATVWDEVVGDLSPEFRRRTRMKLDCRRMRYYGIAVGVVVSIAWAIVVWVWLS